MLRTSYGENLHQSDMKTWKENKDLFKLNNVNYFLFENYEFYLEISSLIRLLSDKDSNFNIKEVREIAIELNKRMIEIEKDETT